MSSTEQARSLFPRLVEPLQAPSLGGLPAAGSSALNRLSIRFEAPDGTLQHMSITTTWLNPQRSHARLLKRLDAWFKPEGCRVVGVEVVREHAT